jgi:hypothetical protein
MNSIETTVFYALLLSPKGNRDELHPCHPPRADHVGCKLGQEHLNIACMSMPCPRDFPGSWKTQKTQSKQEKEGFIHRSSNSPGSLQKNQKTEKNTKISSVQPNTLLHRGRRPRLSGAKPGFAKSAAWWKCYGVSPAWGPPGQIRYPLRLF